MSLSVQMQSAPRFMDTGMGSGLGLHHAGVHHRAAHVRRLFMTMYMTVTSVLALSLNAGMLMIGITWRPGVRPARRGSDTGDPLRSRYLTGTPALITDTTTFRIVVPMPSLNFDSDVWGCTTSVVSTGSRAQRTKAATRTCKRHSCLCAE